MIKITPISAFSDNYIWMIQSEDSDRAYVIDPGDAVPVEKALAASGLDLAGILITHHHFDHTGGIELLVKDRDIPVYGPAKSNIPSITHELVNGDTFAINDMPIEVFSTPGHTLDHIVYYLTPPNESPLLFCGDTLFSGGCGRLFEGTASQMFNSLMKLTAFPDDTRLYCAHEYTLANLKFAQAVEPENNEIRKRIIDVQQLRKQLIPTLPSTLLIERQSNPFLRCLEPDVISAARAYRESNHYDGASVLGIIRAWKDNF